VDGALGATCGFDYPGQLLEPQNDTLVLESRMYFGRCLSGHGAASVWFYKLRNEKGVMEPGVRAVEVVGDELKDQNLGAPLPDETLTKAQVAAGACKEVPGKQMHEETE
jgi:hypothetical protein